VKPVLDLVYPLKVFAVMTAATFACRVFPFLVPRKLQDSAQLRVIGDSLPAAAMLLLVVYCLKGTPFTVPPYGSPELLGVAVVVGLQLWRRNSLLSIGVGTALYMALVRSDALTRLFGR
jgi:branched-subunit amino acid transport protein AzlD